MEMKDFQKLMSELYGVKDRNRGMERTFLWVIEEIGELVRAVKSGDKREIENEFADVIAWLFSLANILDIDMERALEKYSDSCPKCKNKPCICEDRWR